MNRAVAFVFTYRGALVPLVFLPPLLLPAPLLFQGFGEPLSSGAGLLLTAAGLLFRILGVRRIGGRARIHSGGARELLTSGIFGRVRNPLYAGNILYAGGLCTLWISPAGGGLVLLCLWGLYHVVVRYEEAVLLEQFKSPFAAYLEAVPRWIPSFRAFRREGARSGAPVSWTTVLRNERAFLAAGVILSAGGVAFHAAAGGLKPCLEPVPYALRAGLGAAVVGAVSAVLFLRVGKRLRRKRGSALVVERVSGEGRAGS